MIKIDKVNGELGRWISNGVELRFIPFYELKYHPTEEEFDEDENQEIFK